MRRNGFTHVAGLMLKFLGIIAAVIGCATFYESLPTAEQLREHGALKGDADIAALNRGRAIMKSNCGRCHEIPSPDEKSPLAWPGILRRMGGRASLTSEQIKELELYILTVSKAAQDSH